MNYGEDMTAIVAPVTTAPTAKLHLDIKGRAHCGAGDRVILDKSGPLCDATVDQLCKRCLKAIRAAADDDIRAAGGGNSYYRDRNRLAKLQALRDKIRTPQERLNDATFPTKRATLTVVPAAVVESTPAERRSAALAQHLALRPQRKVVAPWALRYGADHEATAAWRDEQLANAA